MFIIKLFYLRPITRQNLLKLLQASERINTNDRGKSHSEVWCETEKRLKQDEDLQKTIRLSVREIIKKIEFLRQRDIRRKMTLCCYKGSSFEQELIKTNETLEKQRRHHESMLKDTQECDINWYFELKFLFYPILSGLNVGCLAPMTRTGFFVLKKAATTPGQLTFIISHLGPCLSLSEIMSLFIDWMKYYI